MVAAEKLGDGRGKGLVGGGEECTRKRGGGGGWAGRLPAGEHWNAKSAAVAKGGVV